MQRAPYNLFDCKINGISLVKEVHAPFFAPQIDVIERLLPKSGTN